MTGWVGEGGINTTHVTHRLRILESLQKPRFGYRDTIALTRDRQGQDHSPFRKNAGALVTTDLLRAGAPQVCTLFVAWSFWATLRGPWLHVLLVLPRVRASALRKFFPYQRRRVNRNPYG